MKHDIHPACEVFPPLSATDFSELRSSIAANGQLLPIFLWQGKIIDGRHRAKACNELKIAPKYEQLNLNIDPYEYAIGANLRRRHLTKSQIAIYIAKLRELQTNPNARNSTGDAPPQGRSFDTAKQGINEKTRFGKGSTNEVSSRTLERAAAVVARGSDRLIAAVESGEISVKTADQIVQSQPDKRKQTEALTNGRQSIKETAGSKASPGPPDLDSVTLVEVGRSPYNVIWLDPNWLEWARSPSEHSGFVYDAAGLSLYMDTGQLAEAEHGSFFCVSCPPSRLDVVMQVMLAKKLRLTYQDTVHCFGNSTVTSPYRYYECDWHMLCIFGSRGKSITLMPWKNMKALADPIDVVTRLSPGHRPLKYGGNPCRSVHLGMFRPAEPILKGKSRGSR